MRKDDIQLYGLYNSMRNSSVKIQQLEENILQKAGDFVKGMFSKRELNLDAKIFDALANAVNDLKKQGIDASGLLTGDMIRKVKDIIENKPNLEPQTPSAEPQTPSAEPSRVSSTQKQTSETTPSTQSAKPKPAAKPSYVPPPKIDLDAYAQKDETFLQQISRKAKENYEAKKRGEPIPFPEIYKKQKQTSETTPSTQSAKPKPAAKSKKTSKTSSTIEKVTPKKSKK